jgi:hypothetical protein
MAAIAPVSLTPASRPGYPSSVDRVLPLANARAAFQLSLGDHRPGKIVPRVADEQDGGWRS